MGCDIHFFTEVKIKDKWITHTARKQVDRNYLLFAHMAGVRNGFNVNPVSMPKGLPDDMAELTKLYYEWEKIDAHSESWLNLVEMQALEKRIDSFPKNWKPDFGNFGYLFGNDWHYWKRVGEYYPEEIEDVRFVFWFDN